MPVLLAALVAGMAQLILPAQASAQITVTEATLGGITYAVWSNSIIGCGVSPTVVGQAGPQGDSEPAGNWTTYTAAACNGLFSCSFTPDSSQACPLGSWPCGDPAEGCQKDFRVKYTCAGDATVKEIYRSASSTDYPVVLSCPVPPPPPVDCAVSDWSAFSACTASCGGGTQTRTRTVTTQPANGGAACPALSETQDCNMQGCPVDCVVSSGGFGSCSVSCGGGTQTELLTIVTPAANGGAACREPATQNCNMHSCDTDGDGVVDTSDSCSGTAAGSKVDANGCSGAQLVANACPTSGSYKNHGAYVSCVAKASEAALNAGLLTSAEKDAIVSAAGQSGIGKK